jgi:ATP-dependent DNA ligase
MPPVSPMLARLADSLPVGPGLTYEPKWDGFRCLAFRDGEEVDLRSRNQRPLGRYFPEVVEALRAVPTRRFAVDGELLVEGPRGIRFEDLMVRLHPAASRVERLRRETPASLVAFDALAVADDDLLAAPFALRRDRLALVDGFPSRALCLTPATADVQLAERWLDEPGPGIDGVVVKRADLPYEPGKRAMVKVKRQRTADCVVAGFRWLADKPLVGSLLLGLYDSQGVLRHVGVASSFTASRRAALVDQLAPYVTELRGQTWEQGFGLRRSPIGRLLGAAGGGLPTSSSTGSRSAPTWRARSCSIAGTGTASATRPASSAGGPTGRPRRARSTSSAGPPRRPVELSPARRGRRPSCPAARSGRRA